MVKLVDPTLPFADVVARHRREQAGAAATTFGLWTASHDWRAVYPEPTGVAGIGASEQALRDPELDLTQRLIGASAGLLVDLGFQVCPVGAITSGMLPASLLVWVAGETTTPQESEQLSSFNVPGVWIGSEAEAADGWSRVETGVFGDRAQFVRQFVAAVASLVEVPEAAYVSNNLSNEHGGRRRTGPDERLPAPLPTCTNTDVGGPRRTRPNGRLRAHNSKVAGSNPAPATMLCRETSRTHVARHRGQG